jgi:hypothetical protein
MQQALNEPPAASQECMLSIGAAFAVALAAKAIPAIIAAAMSPLRVRVTKLDVVLEVMTAIVIDDVGPRNRRGVRVPR